MSEIKVIPVWDYTDDYYFTHIEDIEINIRVYEDDTVSVWVFDNKKDVELLEGEYDIVALEGDLIDLKLYVMDPDGDEITLGYTEPFDNEGMWQTEIGDAGFYSVVVTATDNKDSFVTTSVTLNVLVKKDTEARGLLTMFPFLSFKTI